MKQVEFIIFISIGLIVLFFGVPPSARRLYPDDFCSFQICARDGTVLREILSHDYKTSVWVPLEEISPWLTGTTVWQEDKRFYQHHGFDVFAMVRAVYGNIRHGRIVSGGSTITMQVAKMALGFKRRTFFTKLFEIVYAIKIDLHLSKDAILEIYLNRVPYGNQSYGVEAASRLYFDKPASQLSLSEACALVVIPKSPGRTNPYVSLQQIENKKERMLQNLLEKKYIDSLTFSVALHEPVRALENSMSFRAPHFVDYILAEIETQRAAKVAKVITSLDIAIQEHLEKLVSTTLASLDSYHVGQCAVLVMDVESGEIRAMIGSRDYFDAREGQVNGCISLRQPGSSIKPFLYILALMEGIPASCILPDTILEFRLADGTLFAPRNYGEQYHGPTRLREALASSFNVPAVFLADSLSVQRFHDFLKTLHFENLNHKSHFYGLSLSLGAGEVTLLEMVNGYRALAQKGLYQKPTAILQIYDVRGNPVDFHHEPAEQVFSQEAAFIITHILSDNASRTKAFGEDNPLHLPFPCAAKTGTTKDYRDNWCLGFTTEYAVGVWVGNFDGSSMQGVSGISGAAPLFRDIMIELHRNVYPAAFDKLPSLVHVTICTESGMRSTESCPIVVDELFIPGTEPSEICSADNHELWRTIHDKKRKAVEITHPLHGDIFKIDPHCSYVNQAITFTVDANQEIEEIVLKLNDKVLCVTSNPLEYVWNPRPGEYRLSASGAGQAYGQCDEVQFTVD